LAEGDTILRAAQRLGAALAGQEVGVAAPNPRGRSAGVSRLDGRRLEAVEARGKNLVLRFGDLALHSHLGMNGSWRVAALGAGWGKPRASAWVVLSGVEQEAAQFGGPTLRVLTSAQLRRDPILARLGPDILAENFDLEATIRPLRSVPDRAIGDALLDQHLVAGIGNIFKSEACFAARLDPWRPIRELDDEQLGGVLGSARQLMQDSVARGRPERGVYRRSGQPCPRCGIPVRSQGQGDDNRMTYWCPSCQPSSAGSSARVRRPRAG
jgi:endonuclease-8